MRTRVIQLVQNTCQFEGGSNEDPNEYIKSFFEICDIQKHNGVSSDAIQLMLFPFSIKDKVKIWFYSLPKVTIATWDEMVSALLAKNHHRPRYLNCEAHHDLCPTDGESTYDAWERYKVLLKKASNHGQPP